jgi:intracellular septation protein
MTSDPRRESPLIKLLIDFGPLLVFFLINSFAPVDKGERLFVATGAFMLATAAAMLISKVKLGRISVMLWVTGIFVLLFGGLTLWLHDETFIKIKPTIIYSLFAAILFFGLVTGRPTLQLVLEGAYPGLDGAGWRKLTRNWAWFFVAMAVLNEILWRMLSTDAWVTFKTFGVAPISLVFAFAQAPMMMRHGFGKPADDVPLPPQG